MITLGQALHTVQNTATDIAESAYAPHCEALQVLRLLKEGQIGDSIRPDRLYLKRLKRLAWDKPARTVLKTDGRDTSLPSQCNHPCDDRKLTIPEIKRVGSFPDDFELLGTFAQRWGFVGNSVPPKFMHAIAQHIATHVLDAPAQDFGLPLDFIQKSLQTREPPLFTVVSLFAGIGGSSLGYIWAGGKVALAIEWDKYAVATYNKNFPHTPIVCQDVTTITEQEVFAILHMHKGELDILDFSPPCQGFSTSGKRVLTDPRNTLFAEGVRFISFLQPKIFVMENVSGLVKGTMKHIFAQIMIELKACGYKVRCQLMNAKYFHVPQSRERIIIIGIRNDIDCEVTFPLPCVS